MSQAKSTAQDAEGLQQRVCRACNGTYEYPVLHCLASRFYCENCMELPLPVRSVVEQMNKRIKALTAAVEKHEKALAQLKGPSTK